LGFIAKVGRLEESGHVKSSDFTAVREFQILPAYTQEGIIHFRVYEGSTDTEIFENFIEELLPFCRPFPAPRSVLIMDNASFHYSEKIEQMCDDAGGTQVFMPILTPPQPD
jgi:hypothetical protein